MIDANPPARADAAERARMRAAAFTAQQLWPDAIGEALSQDLMALEEFGYRLDAKALGSRLVAAIDNEKLRRRQQAEQAWAASAPSGAVGASEPSRAGRCAGETCSPSYARHSAQHAAHRMTATDRHRPAPDDDQPLRDPQ